MKVYDLCAACESLVNEGKGGQDIQVSGEALDELREAFGLNGGDVDDDRTED